MYLVEILLPLADNKGYSIGEGHFSDVRRALFDKFGGLTIYARAPALGLSEADGQTKQDDIIVIEVMSEALDRQWWASFRQEIGRKFRQDEILIRARTVEKL